MLSPKAASPRVQEIFGQLADRLPALFSHRERFNQELAVLNNQLDAWKETAGPRGSHGELLAPDYYYDELAALCVGLALADPMTAVSTLSGVFKHLEQQPESRESHLQCLERLRGRRSLTGPHAAA
jgi:hypothetical protein